LPFEEFIPALKELRRVTRKALVLSLPDVSPYFYVKLCFPNQFSSTGNSRGHGFVFRPFQVWVRTDLGIFGRLVVKELRCGRFLPRYDSAIGKSSVRGGFRKRRGIAFSYSNPVKVRGRRSDIRGQMSAVRRQKTDDRRRGAEERRNRGRKSNGR
jgi:hypothetical protein